MIVYLKLDVTIHGLEIKTTDQLNKFKEDIKIKISELYFMRFSDDIEIEITESAGILEI